MEFLKLPPPNNEHDIDKSEDYIQRRNSLLLTMFKTRWDEEEYKPSNKGRKPYPMKKPFLDKNNPRNSKFFNYDNIK